MGRDHIGDIQMQGQFGQYTTLGQSTRAGGAVGMDRGHAEDIRSLFPTTPHNTWYQSLSEHAMQIVYVKCVALYGQQPQAVLTAWIC